MDRFRTPIAVVIGLLAWGNGCVLGKRPARTSSSSSPTTSATATSAATATRHQDAEPRRLRQAGRAAHAVLLGQRRLLAVALGPAHRPHAPPQWRLHLDPDGSDVHLRTSEVTLPKLSRSAATPPVTSASGTSTASSTPRPAAADDHGYDWWLGTQNNAAPSHKDPKNFVRNGKPVGPGRGLLGGDRRRGGGRWLKDQPRQVEAVLPDSLDARAAPADRVGPGVPGAVPGAPTRTSASTMATSPRWTTPSAC